MPCSHPNPTSRLILAIILLFSFALIEVLGSWFANSLALLSDAGHIATDGLSLVLAAVANWIANKPASKQHSYGLGRAEVIGAWIGSLLMVVIAIFIVIHAIERIHNPPHVHSEPVMLVASIGICINLLLAWILSHSHQTLNIRAAIIHIMGDLLGSFAALASGIVIYYTGWLPIDPILSIVIAVLILASTFSLLKETLLVLMEGVPMHLDLAEVGETMANTDGVIAVHDLHIWTLSSGMTVLTAHVELDKLNQWEKAFSDLRKLLAQKYKIHHITLQPEINGQIVHPAPLDGRHCHKE